MQEMVNNDTTVYWLHDLADNHGIVFDYTYLADLPGLLKHFLGDGAAAAHNLTGYVKYDTTTKSTNAALTRVAASDGLIAAGNAKMFR